MSMPTTLRLPKGLIQGGPQFFSNSELTQVKTAAIARGCTPVALATAEAESKEHSLKGQTNTSKAS